MKKNTLLNSDLSYLVSTLGHLDEYTICDAGLPIPSHVSRIDLALTKGIPSFLQTVRALLAESQIEGIILAKEFPLISPECHDLLISEIKQEEQRCAKPIAISYLSHEQFKARTHQSVAVVRTGEYTPYANVIFQAGVVF